MDSDSDREFDYNVPVRKTEGLRIARQLGLPYVSGLRDLPELAKDARLKDDDFAFALDFTPKLIEGVCDSGYFPMAINIGFPIFAIKVHRARCVLLLQVRAFLCSAVENTLCVLS
jgi:hypothetical protein